MSDAKNTYGTTISSTLVGKRTDKDGWEHYEWAVTLEREGQTRHLPYRMGLAHTQTKCGKHRWSRDHRGTLSYPPCNHTRCHEAGPQPAPPTLYDVLTSLKADATYGESFADWCANLGYDTDSISARETYFACQQSEDESRKFFGSDWPKLVDDEEYT